MTPIFDPELSASSYGFRPGRCAHGILMARVARWVSDKRLRILIGRYRGRVF